MPVVSKDVLKFSKLITIYDQLFGNYIKTGYVIMAGGAFSSILSDRPIKDIDIFTNMPDKLIDYLDNIGLKVNKEDDYTKDYIFPVNERGTINDYIIQIIKKYIVHSPEECTKNFDFTIVKGFYDGKDLYFDGNFFKHNERKILSFGDGDQPIFNPTSTLKRVIKYVERGYKIELYDLNRLARAINDLDIDWNNRDQNFLLGGDGKAYGYNKRHDIKKSAETKNDFDEIPF